MAWHVLRYDNLPHDIIEGKMLGKATWGRKRTELLAALFDRRERLWTVERFNLRQFKMET